MRVLANTLTWSTDDLDRYTLALSVLDQPDPRQAKRALPIRLPDDGDTSRVLRNATQLRLGDFQRQFGLMWLIR